MNRPAAGHLPAVLLSCLLVGTTAADAQEGKTDQSEQDQLISKPLKGNLVMDTIVVTAPLMIDPYSISTDPRQPRLPLPATLSVSAWPAFNLRALLFHKLHATKGACCGVIWMRPLCRGRTQSG